MNTIVANEIRAVNGLGANGENLQNWMPLIEAGINAGTTIATTAITARNQTTTGGTVVTGGSTGTYTPNTTTYNKPTTSTTNYTPWIIAGGLLILGVGLLVMNGNNSKKR